MKYADINRRYTEIVAEYIGKGYTINSASMGGSQGETCKVDLTDGSEIIRIMVDTFSDWNAGFEGVEIIIGHAVDNAVKPHDDSDWNTIWNNRLEILGTERFYKIGEDRRHGTFYGSEVEAKAVVTIRQSRYFLRESTRKTENITDKAILSCYLGVMCLVLAIGGVISDHLFPHIPFIANWLNGLPDYEDECEVSKIIDFPGEYAGGCWGIWAIRSADSIFGAAESWVRVHGERLVYPTFAEAADAAEAYNAYIGTENISYTPKAV